MLDLLTVQQVFPMRMARVRSMLPTHKLAPLIYQLPIH